MSNGEQGLDDEQARRLGQYLILKQQWLKTWGVIVQTSRTIKVQTPVAKPPQPRPYLIVTEVEKPSKLSVMVERAKAVTPDFICALLGTGSCVFLGLATTAEVAAAPVSGGGSLALAALTWAGAGASAAGAGMAWGRVINGLTDPELNEILDSETYWNEVSLAFDVISIASLSAARFPAIVALYKESKITGKSVFELMRGMNRASRKRVAQELMRASGETGKSISVSTINAVIQKQLLEAVSTALSVLGSAYGGSINKAYSLTTALIR